MPLGKYYCDYCDKQFQDSPFARKRHLQGLQHLRAKALWYDSFKDPTQGLLKGVCNQNCLGDRNRPSNFQGNQLARSGFVPGGSTFGDKMGMSLGNLPPSLQPPADGGYPSLPFLDWG